MSNLLSLAELVDTNKQSEGVWVKYRDTTFEVKISYYGRSQMKDILDKSKRMDVDPRTLRTTDTLDEKKFASEYAEKVVRDWKGLTAEVLRKIIVMKADIDLPPGFEVPCTKENRMWIIQNSIEFDTWLNAICSNVDIFNRETAEVEVKN